MNDISFNNAYSDTAIMEDIGRFIKQKRIEQNLTQDEVSERAAMSRSTLSLAERGENIALINLIKIMRTLDLLYVFNEFKYKPVISPMQLAKADEKMRKRASKSKGQSSIIDLGW